MSTHDEEVLGKAYDARLMRRLLISLGLLWGRVAGASLATPAGGGVPRGQPYLPKIAIDHFIPPRRLAGLDRLAAYYCALLVVGFVAEFVQTWTMQMTGQRIM